MQKLLKKSVIISSIMSIIPSVYAAPTDEVVSSVGSALGLALGIVGGIIQVILDLFQKDPLYAKAFIAIFMGIYFYTALKEVPAFKGKSSLAGMTAVLIALITAYAVPVGITSNIFSTSSPFFVFILSAFILTLFRHDSRVAHAARGIAYLALTVEFSMLTVQFTGTIQIIIAGFVILTLVLCIYNFVKIGSGIGPNVGDVGSKLWNMGTKNRHPWDAVKDMFLGRDWRNKQPPIGNQLGQGGQQPQGNQPRTGITPEQIQLAQKAYNNVVNQAKSVIAGSQNILKQIEQLGKVSP